MGSERKTGQRTGTRNKDCSCSTATKNSVSLNPELGIHGTQNFTVEPQVEELGSVQPPSTVWLEMREADGEVSRRGRSAVQTRQVWRGRSGEVNEGRGPAQPPPVRGDPGKGFQGSSETCGPGSPNKCPGHLRLQCPTTPSWHRPCSGDAAHSLEEPIQATRCRGRAGRVEHSFFLLATSGGC